MRQAAVSDGERRTRNHLARHQWTRGCVWFRQHRRSSFRLTRRHCCRPDKQASRPSGVLGLVLFEEGPVVLSPSALPAGFGSGVQGRLGCTPTPQWR